MNHQAVMSARAYAPASVGNVGVGFDILGHAIVGAGDSVEAQRSEMPGVRIASIDGVVRELPLDAARNTAGVAVQALLEATGAAFGVSLRIEKGIALGSGMGGSAASAVAALVAANALLDQPLPLSALYPHAVTGEAVASGSRHGDNVAPMLLGGLVLAVGDAPPIRLSTPPELFSALVHPHHIVETRAARAAVAAPVPLHDWVTQSGHLALFLTGCQQGDLDLIRRGLADVLIEPRRAALVPGFAAVKQAALDSGALGCSISGGGPSVFAWCLGEQSARDCAAAMGRAFSRAGLASEAYVSPLDAPGTRLL